MEKSKKESSSSLLPYMIENNKRMNQTSHGNFQTSIKYKNDPEP